MGKTTIYSVPCDSDWSISERDSVLRFGAGQYYNAAAGRDIPTEAVEVHIPCLLIEQLVRDYPDLFPRHYPLLSARTEDELRKLLDEVEEARIIGQIKYKGMSYEDGICEALRWVVGDEDERPYP